MKTYRPYLLIILYLATFFLPFAYAVDLQSFGTATATGFDFVSGHLFGFGLLIILIASFALLKNQKKPLATALLALIGLLWLYLYASPFLVFHLGQTPYLTYLESLLTQSLRFGYYLSALLAAICYAILVKTR